MANKKGSLADKIAGILNTAPADLDPDEEDEFDQTRAKVLQSLEEDEDPQEEEVLSKFRKQNIDLLADVDEKYAGKKASRKSMQDSDVESGSDIENHEKDEEEESASNEEESEEDSDADEDSDAEESEEDYEDSGEETEFKNLTDSNISNQLKKATSVRNQMAMWEHLLEARIQLQKCLLTSNKMPHYKLFNEIKKEPNNDFNNKVAEVKGSLTNLLDKLRYLQQSVLENYPETKKLQKTDSKPDVNESDEEIPSDTEAEESDDETKEASEKPPKKKQKLEDYEKELETEHNKYKEYRNSVIQKWNDKTRLVVKNTQSHSVLNQIDYSLSNREKLVRKTQLKRSQYDILGEKAEEENSEYNPEIFDDDDFYHQLLRELIEFKSADVTDPIQLGRQWIQLQNMRSKMKRKIDTKATKGRKIRYAVHSKLVNFMAPFDQSTYTDEAKNELYNSIFGKNQSLFKN